MGARAFGLAAVISMAGIAGNAATLNLDTVQGTFSNTTANYGAPDGLGTNALDWGVAAIGKNNSGIRFDGKTGDYTSGNFVIGSFTHRNGTIWANSTNVTGTDLNIGISGQLMGHGFSFNWTKNVAVDETLDQKTPCKFGGTPCGDTVSFGSFDSKKFEVAVDGILYTFMVDGFFDAPDGELIDNFQTAERTSNSAYLMGHLTMTTLPKDPDDTTVPPPPPPTVPLPAGAALLLGAIGGFGAIRARRRKA